MKNLSAFLLGLSLLVFAGLACTNNPLAKYTKQYHCSVPGEAEPQTSDEYVRRGYKHLELNGYANSLDQCAFDAASEAVRLDPQNPAALSLRGSLYITRSFDGSARKDEKLVRNSLESALADYTEAIRLEPDRFQFYYTRSAIYERISWLGDTRPKVMADLTKAVELCKDECYAAIYRKRGELNLELGNYEAAVEDFTEAIKLEPNERLYYEKRAEAYRKLGRNDLASKDETTFPIEASTGDTDVKTSTVDSPPSSSKSLPKTISGGVLNGKATNLVQPPYPPAAKAVRAAGAVNVQVTVDENGNVISASAVSGHPLLRSAAVQAARSSKFKPTLLSGAAVKVTGVVVYNFTL